MEQVRENHHRVADSSAFPSFILFLFQDHLDKAIELKPQDPLSYYLLGRWCYSSHASCRSGCKVETMHTTPRMAYCSPGNLGLDHSPRSTGVAQLSWIERRVAATLFGEPPTASIQDALKHFLKCYKELGQRGQAVEMCNAARSMCTISKEKEVKQTGRSELVSCGGFPCRVGMLVDEEAQNELNSLLPLLGRQLVDGAPAGEEEGGDVWGTFTGSTRQSNLLSSLRTQSHSTSSCRAELQLLLLAGGMMGGRGLSVICFLYLNLSRTQSARLAASPLPITYRMFWEAPIKR
ncbi:hypothetical protein JZ751_011079 [Albula glossodonta]|uniref:Uncharacterized protein n=1 Tax=Albula glossodonta TaxID=121402 RepID=A0A8T2NW59_9TELE|nr:hypothetical protein JZ751_011079 [Albula glossodonta]